MRNIKDQCNTVMSTKGIHLYDYQEDMRQRIETEFNKHRSLMVQMPTGTGKTYLLAAVVMDFIVNTDGYVWIVTHRKELVQQVKDTLKRFRQYAPDDKALKTNASVYSIQWLTRHYTDITDKPVLIVIDEAHHAVAKTYSKVINAFPDSKILGLTATPCRLNGAAFTDLFEELLQSWTVDKFIAKGYLSPYDYMSVRQDSADINIISSIRKRGADGDYSVREMSEKLDIKPSIARLCNTVLQYAKGKKGIVYAINIQHAEHIAEFYRENGIKAVAISNITPVKVREDVVRRFKETPTDGTAQDNKDAIQVVVNCELWGEGFDVPDAEFIQLARPTLSLSKYLQMVGRGMRVYNGKKFCLILDNVGSYRLFGLPSEYRDWERMFEGKIAGKGVLTDKTNRFRANRGQTTTQEKAYTDDTRTAMVPILNHNCQLQDLACNYGYKIVKDDKDNCGVIDKDGNLLIPCKYVNIDIKGNATAYIHSRGRDELNYPWVDLINGVKFRREPTIIRKEWLELSTTNNKEFYLRVRSKWIGKDFYLKQEDFVDGIEGGLYFNEFYIQPTEPRKLYKYVERADFTTLYVDEKGNYFTKADYELPSKQIELDEWKKAKKERHEEIYKMDHLEYLVQDYNNDYHKNVKVVQIGFLKFKEYKGRYELIQTSEKYYIYVQPLIQSQIMVRDNICFLGNNYLVIKDKPYLVYRIKGRSADGMTFDAEFNIYDKRGYSCQIFYDGFNPPIVKNVHLTSY